MDKGKRAEAWMMVQVSEIVRRSSHRDRSRRVSVLKRSWVKAWGGKYACLLHLVLVLFAFWVLFGFLRQGITVKEDCRIPSHRKRVLPLLAC